MNRIYFIFFIVVFFFLNVTFFSCKKGKSNAPLEWQNESLRLTSDICIKIRDCGEGSFNSISEEKRKFVIDQLSETNCQKRFRESEAYKVSGEKLLIIQKLYRNCHEEILKQTCADLKSNSIDRIPSCVEFRKFQNQ
ncbi:MAG: hypothetical protein O9301_00470 [Leptospira sp.]|nr:hypothetical protein [Leptospira sp.]